MLRSLPGVTRAEVAGSLRRRRETVGDLDLLVAAADPAAVMEHFCRAGETLARGETKSSILLASGIQVDLRVVPEESFGAALHYFTGSQAHNVAVRALGVRRRGLTINEYGVFEVGCEGGTEGAAGRRIGGAREEDVFEAVGLPWIEPELREDRGEIEAARAGRLPRLIELERLRGDVHVHTSRTDGTQTIEEMARGAATAGHAYIAITDHSRALAMARGLDEAQLAEHAAEVARVDARLAGEIRVFRGIEVDILRDGALDLAADALGALDVVIGSCHSHLGLPMDEMTARLVAAIESRALDIVGHPTGRILLHRDASALDMERVLTTAARHGVAMEISATPDRLDRTAAGPASSGSSS
jgi:DNA polymerase (family 10)